MRVPSLEAGDLGRQTEGHADPTWHVCSEVKDPVSPTLGWGARSGACFTKGEPLYHLLPLPLPLPHLSPHQRNAGTQPGLNPHEICGCFREGLLEKVAWAPGAGGKQSQGQGAGCALATGTLDQSSVFSGVKWG